MKGSNKRRVVKYGGCDGSKVLAVMQGGAVLGMWLRRKKAKKHARV